MQRRLTDYIIVLFKGIAMGAADVVPGVSGGTIAFISGIYEELLESIDNVNLSFIRNLKTFGFKKAWFEVNGNFLLALMLGILFSILSLAKGIKWLLLNEAILLWAFFFGLVLASIVFIGKQIKQWNFLTFVIITTTTVISYAITTAEPFASPDSNIYLFFCGAIAIIAMILPGISGAFILLLLGAYQTAIMTVDNLLDGIINLNFDLLKEALTNFLMLSLGALFGIKAFSRILNWMFKTYKSLTLAMLVGFMIGSLNKIWPWKTVLSTRINSHGEEVPLLEKSISPMTFIGDNQLLLALCLMILGFVIILFLEKFNPQKNTQL